MDYQRLAEESLQYMGKWHGLNVMKSVNQTTQGEIAVLNYLVHVHDGATAGELAEVYRIRTSRIAAILNSLTKKGLARRESDATDGRRVLVFVTEQGFLTAEEHRRKATENMADYLRKLGEEDALNFIRIIRKSLDIFEEKHR